MVLKKVKQIKRLDREKVVKSGWSGKFDKKTDFPKKKKEWRNFGAINKTDHQLEEKEIRDLKEMRELEKLNILKKRKSKSKRKKPAKKRK